MLDLNCLELRKVVDTVPHGKLLAETEMMEISDTNMKWIRS